MLDLLFRAALGGLASSPAVRATAPAPAPAVPSDADTVLERLDAHYRRHVEPATLDVGDLCTLRAGGLLTHVGDPHVVLEVLDEPVCVRGTTATPEETTGPVYGRRYDLRVASVRGGLLLEHLAESQSYEPWTDDLETAWRARVAAAAAAPRPLTLADVTSELRDRAAGRARKADWKPGDLVEIAELLRGAPEPLTVDGVRLGVVDAVDETDGTTRVHYHSASDTRVVSAWARNANLRRHGPRLAVAGEVARD